MKFSHLFRSFSFRKLYSKFSHDDDMPKSKASCETDAALNENSNNHADNTPLIQAHVANTKLKQDSKLASDGNKNTCTAAVFLNHAYSSSSAVSGNPSACKAAENNVRGEKDLIDLGQNDLIQLGW